MKNMRSTAQAMSKPLAVKDEKQKMTLTSTDDMNKDGENKKKTKKVKSINQIMVEEKEAFEKKMAKIDKKRRLDHQIQVVEKE